MAKGSELERIIHCFLKGMMNLQPCLLWKDMPTVEGYDVFAAKPSGYRKSYF